MLSSIEQDYLKALISTYYMHDYKYYLITTVSSTSHDYDLCCYFSKTPIVAVNDNYFEITDAIQLYVDSNAKNTYNNTNNNMNMSSYSGNLTVDVAEFVYTNATIGYELTSLSLNPDLTLDVTSRYQVGILIFLVVVVFIYIFVTNLFSGE